MREAYSRAVRKGKEDEHAGTFGDVICAVRRSARETGPKRLSNDFAKRLERRRLGGWTGGVPPPRSSRGNAAPGRRRASRRGRRRS